MFIMTILQKKDRPFGRSFLLINSCRLNSGNSGVFSIVAQPYVYSLHNAI